MPLCVLVRTTPVTLIDDNQIEKITRELLKGLFLFLRSSDRLIQCKMDL